MMSLEQEARMKNNIERNLYCIFTWLFCSLLIFFVMKYFLAEDMFMEIKLVKVLALTFVWGLFAKLWKAA